MGQGSAESIQAITDVQELTDPNTGQKVYISFKVASQQMERRAQLRLLDYLNISLCECEKPANFTIFVARLKNEILNGKLI